MPQTGWLTFTFLNCCACATRRIHSNISTHLLNPIHRDFYMVVLSRLLMRPSGQWSGRTQQTRNFYVSHWHLQRPPSMQAHIPVFQHIAAQRRALLGCCCTIWPSLACASLRFQVYPEDLSLGFARSVSRCPPLIRCLRGLMQLNLRWPQAVKGLSNRSHGFTS